MLTIKTARFVLVLTVLASLASLVGCGAVVDHLTTEPATLDDLGHFRRLAAAGAGDPAVVFTTARGITWVNEHMLDVLPVIPMLRLEDAVAATVITLSGWQPVEQTEGADDAVSNTDRLASVL